MNPSIGGKIVNCPMANAEYTNDIFIKYSAGRTVSIKLDDSIPLNTIIDKERLKYFNDLYNSDVYFYLSGANKSNIGFIECNDTVGVAANGEEVVALNYNNIDTYCIKSNEYEDNLVIHTVPYGYIKVIGGNNVFCSMNSDKHPSIQWSTLDVLTDTVNKSTQMKKIKEVCGNLDVEELEKVYKMTVASSVTSGIGTVGSIASTVTSAISNNEQKKDDSDDKKVNGLNLATTISSAVGGVASGAGTVTSGIAASKLKKIIDDIKKCKEAINKIQ